MSESTAKFQATISARDETSVVLARIAASTESLAARMGMLRTKERAAASEAPWMQMRGGIGGCSNAVGALTSRLTTMLPMLGGLGAGIGVGGIFTFTESMAKAGVESQDMAKRIGLSFDDLQKYSYMAKMTNVPLESLTGGFTKLNKALGDAQMGKGEALKLFKALRVSLFDPTGGKRQTADVLNDVFLAWAKNPDPSIRESMARTLFGRAGGDMADKIFGMSPAERAQMEKDFERMRAPPLTEQQLEAQRRYQRSWMQTSFAVDQVRMRIGNELAPVLSPVLAQIEQFLIGNQQTIASLSGAAVSGFVEMMQQADWKTIGTDIKGVATGSKTLVDDLGGVKSIIEGIALYKGGEWAAGIVNGLNNIAAAATIADYPLLPIALLAGGAFGAYWTAKNRPDTAVNMAAGNAMETPIPGWGPSSTLPQNFVPRETDEGWRTGRTPYSADDPIFRSIEIPSPPRALGAAPTRDIFTDQRYREGAAPANGEVHIYVHNDAGTSTHTDVAPGSRGVTVESPTGPAFPDYWLGY